MSCAFAEPPSAGIPRHRNKQDEEDFYSALSQIAGHSDAVLNDGRDSGGEEVVGVVLTQREHADDADEERANPGVDIQQLAEMQNGMIEEVGEYVSWHHESCCDDIP